MAREDKWEDIPLVYGDLERPLDREEELVIKQDPKKATYTKIDLKKIRRER